MTLSLKFTVSIRNFHHVFAYGAARQSDAVGNRPWHKGLPSESRGNKLIKEGKTALGRRSTSEARITFHCTIESVSFSKNLSSPIRRSQ